MRQINQEHFNHLFLNELFVNFTVFFFCDHGHIHASIVLNIPRFKDRVRRSQRHLNRTISSLICKISRHIIHQKIADFQTYVLQNCIHI